MLVHRGRMAAHIYWFGISGKIAPLIFWYRWWRFCLARFAFLGKFLFENVALQAVVRSF
jgi:hypothetical protein